MTKMADTLTHGTQLVIYARPCISFEIEMAEKQEFLL